MTNSGAHLLSYVNRSIQEQIEEEDILDFEFYTKKRVMVMTTIIITLLNNLYKNQLSDIKRYSEDKSIANCFTYNEIHDYLTSHETIVFANAQEFQNIHFDKTIEQHIALYSDKKDIKKETLLNMHPSLKTHVNIIKAFEQNEPLFFLTAFNSTGRGQNPQVKIGINYFNKFYKDHMYYPINENRMLTGNETHIDIDFDALFVLKPTFILSNIAVEQVSENKRIVFSEQKLRNTYEIKDLAYRNDYIKDHMHIFCNNKLKFRNNSLLLDCKEAKNEYANIIYQAIGRIRRTNFRKKSIQVYYDKDLCKSANLRKKGQMETNKIILNVPVASPEFQTLINSIETSNNAGMVISSEQKKIAKSTKRTVIAVKNFLSSGNTNGFEEKEQLFWEELRKKLIMFAFKLDRDTHRYFIDYFNQNFGDILRKYHFNMSDFFIKSNFTQYHYMRLENDMYYIDLSNINKNESDIFYSSNVSFEDSQLKPFLQEDWFKQTCKEILGINDTKELLPMSDVTAIINPYIYQAFYKAFVGEIVIYGYLKYKLGLKEKYDILPITNPFEFEVCDFQIKNKNSNKTIFVDVKNYNRYTVESYASNKQLYDKLQKKTLNNDIQAIFVINLFNPSIIYEPRDVFIKDTHKSWHSYSLFLASKKGENAEIIEYKENTCFETEDTRKLIANKILLDISNIFK